MYDATRRAKLDAGGTVKCSPVSIGAAQYPPLHDRHGYLFNFTVGE